MPTQQTSKSAMSANPKSTDRSQRASRRKSVTSVAITNEPGRKILLKFLAQDTETGVTLDTADKLRDALQLGSRTEVIHLALAQLARSTLPRYEADNAPVSSDVLAEIRRRVPQGKMKSAKSLF